MKYVLLLIALLVSGCASKYPKEDLKTIFQLVQEKKFEEAQSKLRGNYETYSGDVISSVEEPGSIKDTTNGLIKSARGTIEYCDKASKDSLDLKANEYNDQSQLTTATEEFIQYCVDPLDAYNSEIFKIKKYADVDLKPMIKGYGSVFFKATRMVSAEFQRVEKDQEVDAARDRATKDAYEQTEDYYSKKLCETKDRIELAKKVIRREREAGDLSGYEDKRKLHEAAVVVQANEERMTHFSGEYKVKFGKAWDSGVCGG